MSTNHARDTRTNTKPEVKWAHQPDAAVIGCRPVPETRSYIIAESDKADVPHTTLVLACLKYTFEAVADGKADWKTLVANLAPKVSSAQTVSDLKAKLAEAEAALAALKVADPSDSRNG